MDFVTIIDKIKKLKGVRSDGAVAEMLGFTRTAFAERKRRRRIPFDEIVSFAVREGVNIHWLITGEGPRTTDHYPGQPGYYDPALLREVIEYMEEQLGREGITLRPGKKAELVTLLYEEVQADERRKSELGEKITRLTRLAL